MCHSLECDIQPMIGDDTPYVSCRQRILHREQPNPCEYIVDMSLVVNRSIIMHVPKSVHLMYRPYP